MTEAIKRVKDSVEQQFSQAAQHYSTSPIHASGPDLAHMLKAARLTGSESILDAGSGAGHTALYFAPHVAQVTACDLSQSMLAQGQRLAEERGLANIQFRRGDVEHLPFGNDEFDRVVTRYSAHHWPNPLAGLREMHRVLRPDGFVLLDDIVSFDDYTIDTHFQAVELLRDASHVRDHTSSQWLDLFDRAGFDAEIIHTWEVFIDFQSWVDRMATPEPARAMIRTILAQAPEEVRSALQAQPDGSFTMQATVLRGLPRR